MDSKAKAGRLKQIPRDPENKILTAHEGVTWAWLGGRETYHFQNIVWRLQVKQSGSGSVHLNLRFVENAENTFRYLLAIGDNTNLGRLDKTGNHVGLGNGDLLQKDQWNRIEYYYQDGEVGFT